MGKARPKNEIWLLLFRNHKPQEIIAVGYPRTTVWHYHAMFHEVLTKYHKASAEIKRSKR